MQSQRAEIEESMEFRTVRDRVIADLAERNEPWGRWMDERGIIDLDVTGRSESELFDALEQMEQAMNGDKRYFAVRLEDSGILLLVPAE
jgi:hypothetical protein